MNADFNRDAFRASDVLGSGRRRVRIMAGSARRKRQVLSFVTYL